MIRFFQSVRKRLSSAERLGRSTSSLGSERSSLCSASNPSNPPVQTPPLSASEEGVSSRAAKDASSSSSSTGDGGTSRGVAALSSEATERKEALDGLRSPSESSVSLSPNSECLNAASGGRSSRTAQSRGSSSPSTSAHALLVGRPPQARAMLPFPRDLPLLLEAPPAERHELFKKKLNACCIIYDFETPDMAEDKDLKRLTLLEIVEYVTNTKHCFTEQTLPEAVKMIAANIFRPLPPSSQRSVALVEPEDEEQHFDVSWPHVQAVYEIFLWLMLSNDVSAALAFKCIDQHFILRLLELFSSEDPRERDYLKTILHRIYGKINMLRLFIRKSIQQVFQRFVYERESVRGISELLEIVGSIINGFTLPLKLDHKNFLQRVMLPLHKSRSFSAFHQQLSYCMQQYVAKDSSLAAPIISGMLRFWPVSNAPKAVLFLTELECVLQYTHADVFREIMFPLFERIAECIQSPHFLVAERALFLWNNENFVRLLNLNKEELFPLLVSALHGSEPWCVAVLSLNRDVCNLLKAADEELYERCRENCERQSHL